MIYAFPSKARPIRQGDIFANIPRVSISLKELQIVNDDDIQQLSWGSIAVENKKIEAILPITSVFAIVATQNCDALSSPEITLCEIRQFPEVDGKAKDAKKPKSWEKIITQQARINQKWFYLPSDPKIGFTEKMAVDFRCSIRVPRMELENFRNFRKGTLNALAQQHFRERLGQFFRRYPYNEWYSLDSEELKAYEKNHKCEVSPKYTWQNDK
ncbi:MAG: hypothetical protein E3J56_11475 [Candidatus Aminicenantes bacterium]|nr:MAG: hypothetical protein E3J56_11475 [Candidatus Aminicenantes bacterium]